jgi:hypothetical protein
MFLLALNIEKYEEKKTFYTESITALGLTMRATSWHTKMKMKKINKKYNEIMFP